MPRRLQQRRQQPCHPEHQPLADRALRFLPATRPAVLCEVLGVVYRTISGHLLARARVRRAAGRSGAVALIQRFGSALNLDVHFHMIFVDGVYVTEGSGAPVFRAERSPGAGELQPQRALHAARAPPGQSAV
jgi:hypothetical protein